MDCSRHRVLACIACASDCCNATDTLCRNYAHNKLTESSDRAHSLDANVAHSSKKKFISFNLLYLRFCSGVFGHQCFD